MKNRFVTLIAFFVVSVCLITVSSAAFAISERIIQREKNASGQRASDWSASQTRAENSADAKNDLSALITAGDAPNVSRIMDPDTGRVAIEIKSDENGRVREETLFDSVTGKPKTKRLFDDEGMLSWLHVYDPRTGALSVREHYDAGGELIEVFVYDLKKGGPVRRDLYAPGGKLIGHRAVG